MFRHRVRVSFVSIAYVIFICLAAWTVLCQFSTSLPKAQSALAAPPPSPASLASFLDVVPDDTGVALHIRVRGVPGGLGSLFANVELGPTQHKDSYTMQRVAGSDTHVATALGLRPGENEPGRLNITSTLGLATTPLEFTRAWAPRGISHTIDAAQGLVRLEILNPDTLLDNVYIAIIPSYAPPAPPPLGYPLISPAYTIRASGTTPRSIRPMLLFLHYIGLPLGNVDPNSLVILDWNAGLEEWYVQEGHLHPSGQRMNLAISYFTTYALAAGPLWRDPFEDLTGLDMARTQGVGIDLNPQGETVLGLDRAPGVGVAISRLIQPPRPHHSWSTVSYVAATPSHTTMTIDILDAEGTPLLTNVAAGASLAEIDPRQHSSLRLRASLTSTQAGVTPSLNSWRITWRYPTFGLYFPHLTRRLSP